MLLVRSKCRDTVKAGPTSTEEATPDNQALCETKTELLNVFFQRYDWRLPVELTTSDQSFILVVRSHRGNSSEFTPLSRVASMVDVKDTSGEHGRIKGTNGDLISDPTKSLTRRNTDFNLSDESFNFAARVLMYGYVLASCSEERNDIWRPLQSAMKHITSVEAHTRSGTRAQQ